MEVDNVQVQMPHHSGAETEWKNRTVVLKRAISTVTRATERDLDGMYGEAVTLYDTALSDFNTFLCSERSEAVRDCMMTKMDAYADRSSTLKKFLERSRSPSGSLGAPDGDATETSASSDSGVETVDDLGTGHNLSADSGADDCDYATIYEPRKHQQQSRQHFLDACAQQVEQLLQISRDENEPVEVRDRARAQCLHILDVAEEYRRDFCPTGSVSGSGSGSDSAVCTAPEPVPPPVVRTVSVASSVAPADPLQTRQLVRAEVLYSDGPDVAGDDEEEEVEHTEDDCPELPGDGDSEFQPLTFSIDSLRFADAESRRSDSPDYATVRRATPSPRKHLSQASLNKIELDGEPLLGAGGGSKVSVLPVSTQRRRNKWWKRNSSNKPQPEPMDRQLSEPSMFWVVLGSICG